VFAQKKIIGFADYDKFQFLGSAIISQNGKYTAYGIKNGTSKGAQRLVIQSTKNNWRVEVPAAKDWYPSFTSDSKYCLFATVTDSLGIMRLKDQNIRYIPGISSFNISEQGSDEWLIYNLIKDEKTLFVENLRTGLVASFPQIYSYWLSENGKEILFQQLDRRDEQHHSLSLVKFSDMKSTTIYSGEPIENVIVDFKNQQLAFKSDKSIWYYKFGTVNSVCLIDSSYALSNPDFKLGSIQKFSLKGDRLFINLSEKDRLLSKPAPGTVKIWSYTDIKLQSQQENELNNRQLHLASINLDNHKLVYLQKYQDESRYSQGSFDKFFLASHPIGGGDYNDQPWVAAAKRAFELVDAYTGGREKLEWLSDINARLSPEGKYIIYYDEKQMRYCSYDLASSIHHKITGTLLNNNNQMGRGIVAWFPQDDAVFVYDNNDIWKLDPSGKNKPVNLTNGYGLKHNIIFTLALNNGSESIISRDKPLILSAFNNQNKNNGFFSKCLDKSGDPELLTMGPYVYHLGGRNSVQGFIFTPIRGKDAETYIIQRMSAAESPNYFSTTDFKTFIALSNLQSQKDYNWYTTELHTWKSLDGRDLQGILYKPENFDLKKRYPVVFYFYERLSDGLNLYLKPEFRGAEIDIATYVSNGYLVFCPDIYYRKGDAMQGTYDAVVSAANYVSRFSFVDQKKMGIQGHSFGGGQTNYLVTQTNLFAAACSSSGVADWISGYGTVVAGGNSKTLDFERGQYRMGTTLWENIDGYIKGSPIFHADKVSTPLLMKHGEKDGTCPYPNALEFFLGLRRLGKRVWILDYPEGAHTLFGNDAEDFDARMMQFFDHYLKDKPAPVWMLDGISATMRGIDTGLELDKTGRTPGLGLLSPGQQKKLDSLMTKKPEITRLN